MTGQLGSCINHAQDRFTPRVGEDGTHLSVMALPQTHSNPVVTGPADMDFVGRTIIGYVICNQL